MCIELNRNRLAESLVTGLVNAPFPARVRASESTNQVAVK